MQHYPLIQPRCGVYNGSSAVNRRGHMIHPIPLLSVAIIARDEARHLADCLASLHGIAGEVVVLVDSAGSDATAEIAAAAGARVYHAAWRGFPGQRNLALDLCRGEWVLFIDADERLTAELTAELLDLLPKLAAGRARGYRLPRRNLFFGRPLRAGGWYPDYQLRLLHRTGSRYDEQIAVHETAAVDGPIADLHGHLLHINIETLGEFGRKQARYAWAEARSRLQQQRRARRRNLIGGPLREGYYRLITLQSWRDGLVGLFLAVSMAWFELVTQLMWRTSRTALRSDAAAAWYTQHREADG
jgi:glycosyltransferase involved in cell wall biosynthesis